MSFPRIMGTIRPFRITDLYDVASIARESFREHYTLDFFEGIWHLAPDTFLLMEENGKIQGFILGVQTDIDEARILMLAIKKSYRRQGIGTFLLKMFLDCIKDRVKRVFLEVHWDNSGAIAFYQYHGFQVKGSIKNFYTDGSDAYIMEKRVP